jgi:hypothetical protein
MNLNGFYASDNGLLSFAGTSVYFPDGLVMVEADKASYSFPYRGWYWFVNESAARTALNLPDSGIPAYTGPSKDTLTVQEKPFRVNKIGIRLEPKKFTPRPSYLII